ncbi:hypothetical protein [Isoptericola sp. BMS4]|uniref:hypothetical protein n=1 Tax=Isoptericola sp. BMS4 TaxID=2527875 RepID=UPI001420C50D|nr:hypothetical protein [Isoptericola sp. BMS4]
MTSPQHPQHPRQHPSPQHPAPQPRPGIPWAVVAGLASMALLWPLTALTGIGGTGAPRALTIVAITAVVWIGVVGFGRVPRPVATLTLTGLAFGVVAMLVSMLFGGVGMPGDGAAWTVIPALAMDTVWGALAGLVALAVQKARGEAR